MLQAKKLSEQRVEDRNGPSHTGDSGWSWQAGKGRRAGWTGKKSWTDEKGLEGLRKWTICGSLIKGGDTEAWEGQAVGCTSFGKTHPAGCAGETWEDSQQHEDQFQAATRSRETRRQSSLQ